MPEPVLREILPVVLNNPFGPSGGELFSRSGKTDVAISSENGALFIAECKFWSGEKGFDEAIEQLLGYLVWRDTKSALVLFMRQKNGSDVQEKALNLPCRDLSQTEPSTTTTRPAEPRKGPNAAGCKDVEYLDEVLLTTAASAVCSRLGGVRQDGMRSRHFPGGGYGISRSRFG